MPNKARRPDVAKSLILALKYRRSMTSFSTGNALALWALISPTTAAYA